MKARGNVLLGLRGVAGLTTRGAFHTLPQRGGGASGGAPKPFTLHRGAAEACGVVPAAPPDVFA